MATKRQQRTSLQSRGGRVAYYTSPTSQTLVVDNRMVGRDKGVYQYQTAGGQRIAGKPPGLPSKTYHRIVLAEFVLTVVIIGLSPVLTSRAGGATGAAENAGNAVAAVTLAGPVVRLTAACVVFFVLALMATGERAGKVAAAFGALVVLGALLNATDEISLLASALTGGKTGGGGG